MSSGKSNFKLKKPSKGKDSQSNSEVGDDDRPQSESQSVSNSAKPTNTVKSKTGPKHVDATRENSGKKPLSSVGKAQPSPLGKEVPRVEDRQYDDGREYLHFFEQEMYPVMQRIKQSLLEDKPSDIVASFLM